MTHSTGQGKKRDDELRDTTPARSCYIIKPSKRAMADSTIIVQRSAKYSLREKVDRLYMSTGTISKHCKMCSTVFNRKCQVENYIYEVPFTQQYLTYTRQYLTYTRQCREVINKAIYKNSIYEASCEQCKVGNHIYEASYKQELHTSKQCSGVDEQVGFAMVLLDCCCRNKAKQMQNELVVTGIQVLFNKAT